MCLVFMRNLCFITFVKFVLDELRYSDFEKSFVPNHKWVLLPTNICSSVFFVLKNYLIRKIRVQNNFCENGKNPKTIISL